jgi:hypothetical protein
MAFLTACRKARAWQQQLRTLASLHSLQNDPTSPAISWVYAQRFHSTTTTPSMAAAAAVATEVPVVQPPKPAGKYRRFPKRQKLDHDDILGTATRVFNMSLGTEKGFIDDGSGEEEEARDVTTDAEPRPVISPELLEEHEERLKAMDKKRAKYPLMAGRVSFNMFVFISFSTAATAALRKEKANTNTLLITPFNCLFLSYRLLNLGLQNTNKTSNHS